MSERIHVRDKATGHEYVIWTDTFDPEAHTKTGKPAFDASGDPVPVKYRTTVDKSAAAKQNQPGQTAEPDKETT